MKPFHSRLFICFLTAMAALPAPAQQDRTISGTANPLVQISIMPPAGTSAWSVEESLSAGAVSIDVNEAGVFDEENGKVKWGPFLDDAPRTLTYHLTGPAGDVTIDGTVSFDGSSEPIATMDLVTLPDPATSFSGWRYLTLPGDLLQTLAAHPLSDMNLNGFTLLQEYAFGLFAPEILDGPVMLAIPGSSGTQTNADLSYYRNRFAADLEFILQQYDPSSGWLPADLGITPQEFVLGTTDQVSEVVYPAIPLASIEGLFLRVQARLVEP